MAKSRVANITFKGNDYTCWIETVTPERAQELIDSNGDRNRKLRPGRVARYAADMRSGNWRMTGETIRLDEEGRLLNGQHRLAGVIASGCSSVDMFFISGISSETMLVQDTGLPTSPEDWMPVENGAAVTKTMRAIIRVVAPAIANTISRDEIIEVYQMLGEEHVQWAVAACSPGTIGRKAPVMAALAIIRKLAPKRAALFAKRLNEHDLPANCTESSLHRALTTTNRRRSHDNECALSLRAVVSAVRDKDMGVSKLYQIGDRDIAWLVKEAGLEGVYTLRQAA